MNSNETVGISREGAEKIKIAINDYLTGYSNTVSGMKQFFAQELPKYTRGEQTRAKFKQLSIALSECLLSYQKMYTDLGEKLDDVLTQYESYDSSSDSAINDAIDKINNRNPSKS